MQEIHYKDGTKTKEFFDSMFDALDDAKEKAKFGKTVKKVIVTRVIPKKRTG